MINNKKQKVALITGASSGIGKAVAELMSKDGFAVYGTSRRANYEQVDTGGASYTMLPVTLEDESTIEAAVQYIIDTNGRIDVLVNAAGSGIAGAVEETTADEARQQFDVCFFGVISVLNHVLPHMRSAGSGMVINIGSMAACFPVPYQSMYSAVKSALFMLTATLKMELAPFGVNACVIEPGDTKTGFTDKRIYAKKTADTAYRQPFERALYEMIRSELASPGPQRCARMVLRTSKQKNPPIRKSVGLKYKLLYSLSKAVPWRFKFWILRLIYLSKNPPKGAVWTYDKQFKE